MGSVLRGFFPLPVWRVPVPDRGLRPGRGARLRAAGARRGHPGLAGRAGRADRGDPHRLPLGQGWRPRALARPRPAARAGPRRRCRLRNVLRAPRRTLMTMLGIAAAIVVLIGVIGMVDSFLATIDRGERELTKSSPAGCSSTLDSFYPDRRPQVTAIEQSPLVRTRRADPAAPGSLHHGHDEHRHLRGPRRPRAAERGVRRSSTGSTVDGPGIVISETAADDLGVQPGDTVVLRHPRRDGPAVVRARPVQGHGHGREPAARSAPPRSWTTGTRA